jgi:hypothetical protein
MNLILQVLQLVLSMLTIYFRRSALKLAMF